MKKSKRVAIFLIVLFLFLSSPCKVFATTEEEEAATSAEVAPMAASDYEEVCFYDVYGWTGWPSLSAAMNHYGRDWTYVHCGGHPYNYYYIFSDNSRMYFGVLR